MFDFVDTATDLTTFTDRTVLDVITCSLEVFDFDTSLRYYVISTTVFNNFDITFANDRSIRRYLVKFQDEQVYLPLLVTLLESRRFISIIRDALSTEP
jgi:hypothetical protein